jgi:putative phosphoserine phosphatase / 1-acylglycerol-3-phosphate O-acyltransferase
VSVAFIDVDGTLTRTNISFLFGRHLYAARRISFFEAVSCAFLYGCHVIGLLNIAHLHYAVFNMVFHGKSRTDVVAWAEEFFSLNKSSLFRPSMMDELFVLREKQVPIVLLSSSPDFLIALVAKALGGLDYCATEYKNGCDDMLSCIGTVMSGAQKRLIALEYRKSGTNRIFAFTDSLQDRPLLEVSDEVVAVCPEKGLKRLALKRGWRIVPK